MIYVSVDNVKYSLSDLLQVNGCCWMVTCSEDMQ